MRSYFKVVLNFNNTLLYLSNDKQLLKNDSFVQMQCRVIYN